MTRVRFMQDDPAALWAEDDHADWMGRETPYPNAPNIHVFKLDNGQQITLTDPFERGIVELTAGTLCPVCQTFIAASPAEEIAHMEANHRDLIDERLMAAGIEVADYRTRPDLPSYMTLKELQTLFTFACKYAIEQAGFGSDNVEIGIHVRDRGRIDTDTPLAPWIEFMVGAKCFALWRNNLDLYEVGPDGAVADEPIHRND